MSNSPTRIVRQADPSGSARITDPQPDLVCLRYRRGENISPRVNRRSVLLAAACPLIPIASAQAQSRYGPGATNTEIKLGQTMPYSGPASAYGTLGKAQGAYFRMINDAGGINGRKIKLISLDDGYSPPKTVEQVRKLIEQEEVLALFSTLGTACNAAIHKYVNSKKVPHLLVSSGSTQWADPKNFPWTLGFNLNYQAEGTIYARYLQAARPDARIAILYQNDDYGRDLLKGVRDGLGAAAVKMIVAEASYEVSDPTVDSQIVSLQASGADTFINISTAKFAAQAIRRAWDSGWKPLQILNNVSASTASVLTPAGLDKSVGVITSRTFKPPLDPQWKDDPAIVEWRAFMARYYPEGDLKETFNVSAYIMAQTMAHILTQCGNDLTRENVMRQAANIKDLKLPLLLPGVSFNTTPTDYMLLKQAQLARFDGNQWLAFGPTIDARTW